MVDAYFDTALTDIVKAAYDRMAYNKLRAALVFKGLAKVKPTMQTAPGSSVTFTFWDDLAAQTSDLSENTDPDFLVTTTSTKSVTLAEKGAVARTSKKLRGTSFISPAVDQDVAELIGYNAGLSYDTLHRDQLVAGSNVVYAGTATARNEVSANENVTAAKVRYVVAKMRGANAETFDDDRYLAFIHPDCSVDLRAETGADAWVQPANYQEAIKRWKGMIGSFEGATFVEASRAPYSVDAGNGSGGAGTIDVYHTLFLGRQSLCMAWSKSESGEIPEMVDGPIVDRLKRHHTYGWYWLGGIARFREEAIYRLEAASTIGSN